MIFTHIETFKLVIYFRDMNQLNRVTNFNSHKSTNLLGDQLVL